jgi:hypothetical protein
MGTISKDHHPMPHNEDDDNQSNLACGRLASDRNRSGNRNKLELEHSMRRDKLELELGHSKRRDNLDNHKPGRE